MKVIRFMKKQNSEMNKVSFGNVDALTKSLGVLAERRKRSLLSVVDGLSIEKTIALNRLANKSSSISEAEISEVVKK